MRSILVGTLLLAIAASAPAADTPARITGIAAAAAVDGSAIVVTFAVSDARRDLLLFWGTAPMGTAEDLLGAAVAHLDAGTARYAVPVVPGAAWWFAVLDAELYKVGGAPLAPGGNTTVAGVRAPGDAAATAPRRGAPLPALQLDRAIDTGREVGATNVPALPPTREVSPATARAIAVLMQEAGAVTPPVLKVQVLAPEADVDSGDAVLRAAAQLLALGEWAQAEKRLKDYLSIRRTGEPLARARFYLGQAYWFQDQPREAFFEFLLCGNELPRESSAWQQTCLAVLADRD
jgi:hypothetical protein